MSGRPRPAAGPMRRSACRAGDDRDRRGRHQDPGPGRGRRGRGAGRGRVATPGAAPWARRHGAERDADGFARRDRGAGVGDRAIVRRHRHRGWRRWGWACPGLVDDAGMLRFAPNLPGGDGLDVAGRLRGAPRGLRVVVDNDATCATMGEWALRRRRRGHRRRDGRRWARGSAAGRRRRPRGPGGARASPARSATWWSTRRGRPCPCGKRGCWERFASGSGPRSPGPRSGPCRTAGRSGAAWPVGIPRRCGASTSPRGGQAGDAGAPGRAGASSGGGWRWASPTWRRARPRRSWSRRRPGRRRDLVLERGPGRVRRAPRGHAYRPEVQILPALLGERAGAMGAALVARAGDRYRVDAA